MIITLSLSLLDCVVLGFAFLLRWHRALIWHFLPSPPLSCCSMFGVFLWLWPLTWDHFIILCLWIAVFFVCHSFILLIFPSICSLATKWEIHKSNETVFQTRQKQCWMDTMTNEQKGKKDENKKKRSQRWTGKKHMRSENDDANWKINEGRLEWNNDNDLLYSAGEGRVNNLTKEHTEKQC